MWSTTRARGASDRLCAAPNPAGTLGVALRQGARLVDVAERVRAPTLMAASARFLGVLSLDRSPPDFNAAIGHYKECLDLARQCGDVLSVGDGLRAVAMCEVGLRPTDSLGVCRDALLNLYEMRYWFRIWQLSDSNALALASGGHVEAASVIVGYLQARHQPYGIECELGFPERTLELIRQHREVDQWIARGAAMDRHQIVDHMVRLV